jgi:hypothetical protein
MTWRDELEQALREFARCCGARTWDKATADAILDKFARDGLQEGYAICEWCKGAGFIGIQTRCDPLNPQYGPGTPDTIAQPCPMCEGAGQVEECTGVSRVAAGLGSAACERGYEMAKGQDVRSSMPVTMQDRGFVNLLQAIVDEIATLREALAMHEEGHIRTAIPAATLETTELPPVEGVKVGPDLTGVEPGLVEHFGPPQPAEDAPDAEGGAE